MKKIYCVLMAVVLMFMVGCSKEKTDGKIPAENLPSVINNDYNHGKYVVSDGENTYFAHKSTIYRLTDEGIIPLMTKEGEYINRIMVMNGQIYFCTVENMYVMNKDGGEAEKVISMLFSDGTIRWLDAEAVGEDIYLFNDSYGATRSKLIVNSDGTYDTETVEYEHKYINGRGMEYNYIPTGECGGNITMANSQGEKINIVSVNHRNMAVVTDDYIFTMSGELNDGTDDVSLYRWSLTADEMVGITAFPSNVSFIEFAGYDKENVYIRDMYNSRYYGFDQTTGEKVTADIEYQPGVQADICDGWLYYLRVNEPYRVNMLTGEQNNL